MLIQREMQWENFHSTVCVVLFPKANWKVAVYFSLVWPKWPTKQEINTLLGWVWLWIPFALVAEVSCFFPRPDSWWDKVFPAAVPLSCWWSKQAELVGSPRKSHLPAQKRAMIGQELMDRGQLYFGSILSALCGCFVGLFSSKEDEMLQFKSVTSIGAYWKWKSR